MSYTRDPDHYTRGVGAIASADRSSARARMRGLVARQTAARDRKLARLASAGPRGGALGLGRMTSEQSGDEGGGQGGPGGGGAGGGGGTGGGRGVKLVRIPGRSGMTPPPVKPPGPKYVGMPTRNTPPTVIVDPVRTPPPPPTRVGPSPSQPTSGGGGGGGRPSIDVGLPVSTMPEAVMEEEEIVIAPPAASSTGMSGGVKVALLVAAGIGAAYLAFKGSRS